MKKTFLVAFMILFSGILSYGQDPDRNLQHLSSSTGKHWKIQPRVDGYNLPESMQDDVFIFYSNGQFDYDASGTATPGFSNAKKSWTFNRTNYVITMEFNSPGVTKKMEAELTFINEKKVVFNISENGAEPNIVIMVAE